ncbi:MAG: cellulose-binding protein [Micromonosporaceae bacterium]|nr:cellulose-binding protein [Micromonosporaceae bacterium]
MAQALAGTATAAASVVMIVTTAMPSQAATQSAAPGSEVVPAAASAGCGKTATIKSGTYSMQVNGKNRTYIIKVPDNYDKNHAYRLIFGVHWLGGNATDVANGGMIDPYYGLLKLANNSAIFVAPQGLSEAMGTGWANTGGQDVTFFDEMIKTVEAGLCVDTTQLFSLGFSYGGGMSYALACARPTVFRAVAIYDGGIISGCSGGTGAIAYLQSHGVSDTVLSISMARTMRDRFVKNNGCTAASPPEPNAGSGTHTSFAYSGCSTGHPVEWYAFDGGHTPVPPDNGKTWLPQATWKFFSQFQSASAATAR